MRQVFVSDIDFRRAEQRIPKKRPTTLARQADRPDVIHTEAEEDPRDTLTVAPRQFSSYLEGLCTLPPFGKVRPTKLSNSIQQDLNRIVLFLKKMEW
jgi:hypothetical protein